MWCLCYKWAGSNTTKQLYSSMEPRAKTAPPLVKWEIKPACTIPEELNSSLVVMPGMQSTTHLTRMKPSVQRSFPSAGRSPCYPGGETSQESFLRDICVTQHQDQQSQTTHLGTFTFRLGVRGLRLSWMKLWWTQANAGNSPASHGKWPNDHDLQRSFPTNSSVCPWARTWGAQEENRDCRC